MSKIWIDIITPKQVMLFGKLAKEFENEHELLITTREYKETNELLELKGISAKVIGKHGGRKPEKKLNASIERMLLLNKLIQTEKPNVLISLASPEASRIAFGLKIPHMCINDIPEAEAVTRLTAPLATILVTPKLIPKKIWEKYGVKKENIIQYNALDPIAWLKDFKADENILQKLKIEKEKQIITFRTEEIFASYLSDKFSPLNGSIVLPIINELMEKIDANFVVIPRYKEQEDKIKKSLNKKVIIPNCAIDGQSLLYYSNIFIGSGGTMTLEAALLGTPTISCRQINTMYESYAIKHGLVIKVDSKKAAVEAEHILKNNELYKKRLKEKAKKLIKKMDDPIEIIKSAVQKFV